MPSIVSLTQLAERIHRDLDTYEVSVLSEGHRTHLGASVIGHDCDAYVWNAFRWISQEVFSARMLRLFERGHLEEQRWIKRLRGIGFKVWEHDNNGKQFRIYGAQGHYGGSNDGVGIPPYPEFPDPMLCEFKTYNKKQFAKLIKDKVRIAKPRHYTQMCQYGKAYGFKLGLYCASCKDDDEIHIEVVELDYGLASDDYKRAERIIGSQERPAKIALQSTYFECKMCPFQGHCHYGQVPEKNCRSCRFAIPTADAKWKCTGYDAIIPDDVIKVGCQNWASII